MTAILHHAALIHVAGMAALLAITLMTDRLIACSVRIVLAPAEQPRHRRERIMPTNLG